MNNTEPDIRNVFVLMLENHSFDNIFAMSGIQGINAATVQDWNSYNGEKYPEHHPAPDTFLRYKNSKTCWNNSAVQMLPANTKAELIRR